MNPTILKENVLVLLATTKMTQFFNIRTHLKNEFTKKKIIQDFDIFQKGTQDAMDVLSYTSLTERDSYVIVDGQFIRTIAITGYPYIAHSNWLSSLVSVNQTVDISFHIERIDARLALPQLQRKITEFESTKRAMIKRGSIISSELLDPLDSAISLRDSILRGKEKLFQVSLYIGIKGSSLQEIQNKTTLIETILGTKLFVCTTASYQQIEGFQSILPRGENVLAQKRNLDSSTASLMFPFISSELVQEKGILYGINKTTNSLIMIDRFSLQNANSIIFAQSGSGKSYTAKVEILRHLLHGTQVVVLDPEGEYEQLASSVKGTYIKLSNKSKEKINPFAIKEELWRNSHNTLTHHIQVMTDLLSVMAQGLSPSEKAAIDRALLLAYTKRSSKVGKKRSEFQPLLKDILSNLSLQKHAGLLDRLEKYTKGSSRHLFDKQTNIDMSNRLIVFNIKNVPDSMRELMMLIISQFVTADVFSSNKKRLLVIDEGWMLMQHKESARFISGIVRRARKHFLGVTIITQQAEDFLNNEYGRVIASQSSFRILMRQDTTTIKKVVSEFNLSEYEGSYLLTCEKGEALIIADQNHVAVKIIASEKEHPLITTDPQDM